MSSEVRRTENEFILQSINNNVAEKVKDIAPGDTGRDVTLNFRCECSELNCKEYITLQIDTYQHITKQVGQFVVFPTHEQLDIETAVYHNPGYTMVQKRLDLIHEVA